MVNAKPRVALVCDWLTGAGGAERVVLELHKMYPEAPIFTSQYNADPKVWHGDEWFSKADIRTGFLQKLPKPFKKFLSVLRILYFSRLNFDDYDLVISSSGAEAKGIKVKKPTVHINYCHAPTHYYWSRYDEYLQNPGFGLFDPLARLGLRVLVGPLRRWDFKAAQRPDFMIANSSYTKEQIKKYYGRDSIVIYPPVDIDRFQVTDDRSQNEARRGFVTAGRQTPYKRIGLAVQACTNLEFPLIVLGSGPDHSKLQKMAGKTVTFLRGKSDEEVAHYFKTAEAFIFPGIDDFGIVAVEALAAGTPVIAYHAGGALDYIKPGKNGLFFDIQNVEDLEKALQKFKPEAFNTTQIVKSAQAFSPENFKRNIKNFINKVSNSSDKFGKIE